MSERLTALWRLPAACVGDQRPLSLCEGVVRSRAEFAARAAAWAACLQGLPGRDWALHFGGSHELLCALFGAWVAGKTVWLPADLHRDAIAALATRVDGFVGEFDWPGSRGEPGAAMVALPECLPLDAALMVFTSGSSGDPVAIPKTVQQLDAEVQALHAVWGEQVADAMVVATVPHRHLYGLLFKLLWPLQRAVPFMAHMVSYPEEVVQAMTQEAIVWVASPALLKRLPAELPWQPAGVRAVFSSGAPLDFPAAQRVGVLCGQPVIEVFGSSESGGVGWRSQAAADTCWQPLPGVIVTVADDGVLCIRSPWLDGGNIWRSADRGEMLADGGFRLGGRVDRIAKVEDKRVSLDHVERTLAQSDLVAAARVLQLDGGRVGAVVVPSAAGWLLLHARGRRALGLALRVALAGRMEALALPRRWRFVSTLPQDDMGKCTRAACLALLAADAQPLLPQVLHEECTDFSRVLDLFIAHELLWFDGHFPAMPVLAGVVQLHWAITFGRTLFGLRSDFHRLEQVKFHQVIQPGTMVRLELQYRPDRNALQFVYRSVSGTHSSGRVCFALQEPG